MTEEKLQRAARRMRDSADYALLMDNLRARYAANVLETNAADKEALVTASMQYHLLLYIINDINELAQ